MTIRTILICSALPVIFLVSCQTPVTNSMIPVGDVYDRKRAEIHMPGFHPNNEMPPIRHKSLNPLLADGMNDPYPFPYRIKDFGNFQEYYQQLLTIPPLGHVRSKIFDQQEFNKVRKIEVRAFENKTIGPNKDNKAGKIVTAQAFQELRSAKNYSVTAPLLTEEEGYRLEIKTKSPQGQPAPKGQSGSKKGDQKFDPLFTREGPDAIMTGTVTQFVDTYVDNHGKVRESISSGVAFAAFLVDAETKKPIWGAIYRGSQEQNLRGFLKYQGRWLSKEEFSRMAMKSVLRDFYRNR